MRKVLYLSRENVITGIRYLICGSILSIDNVRRLSGWILAEKLIVDF